MLSTCEVVLVVEKYPEIQLGAVEEAGEPEESPKMGEEDAKMLICFQVDGSIKAHAVHAMSGRELNKCGENLGADFLRQQTSMKSNTVRCDTCGSPEMETKKEAEAGVEESEEWSASKQDKGRWRRR